MSDACVTDSFARAKEAWSGSIRSPYPDGGASSGSYPPIESLRHGRGRCQSRMRVDGLECRGGGRIAPVCCGSFASILPFRSLVRYPQHRTSPRPTETRLLVAFLRPICKEPAQPPQLLRLGFARSGDM